MLALPACKKSSSGGGGGASPTISAAAYVGSGTPANGETLLLFMSEDVTLAAGKLLTDADVTLSGSGTLGTVTAPPLLIGARTVSITLGSGVAFTPGVTTVAFQAGNDVVLDLQGLLGQGGTAVVIGTSDGAPPTIGQLTLNGIQDELNGTGPAGGTLQAPQHTWTVDLNYADNTAVDPTRTQVSANVAVATSAGTQPPGTNLVPFLTQLSAGATSASYRVPTSASFPAGAVTLTAFVVDVTGLASTAATFSFTVKAFTDALRPFETSVNASQVWFLDTSRDVESYSVAGTTVNVVAGTSGTSDFEEILIVLGLLSASNTTTNGLVVTQFQNDMLTELAALNPSVNVVFTFTPQAGSFGGNSSVPYNSLGFSQISLAGAPSAAGTLGVAIFDPNNATQNDDTLVNFQSIRLGVFLHTIVQDGIQQMGATLFRTTYDPFTPAHSGTPIGDHVDGLDQQRLQGTQNDARKTQIDTAIARMARFVAVVAAHECGHSMGLVQNGAMPVGLYGGDATNFPGSSSGHIRNASLFPVGSTNIMSPSLNLDLSVNAATAFNTLNLAYLRERVLYGN